jgi:hypothetical protein
MRSAFGVEHDYSEVEKANPLAALRTFGATARSTSAGVGTAIGAATHKAGGALVGRSANVGAKLRARPGVANFGRSAGVGAAGLGQRGGGGLKRLGGGMMKRPGLTGGAAIGGVAAAPTAYGVSSTRRRS